MLGTHRAQACVVRLVVVICHYVVANGFATIAAGGTDCGRPPASLVDPRALRVALTTTVAVAAPFKNKNVYRVRNRYPSRVLFFLYHGSAKRAENRLIHRCPVLYYGAWYCCGVFLCDTCETCGGPLLGVLWQVRWVQYFAAVLFIYRVKPLSTCRQDVGRVVFF